MTALLTLAAMLDREAIRDCIYRAALANDMRDAAAWKGAYWPDGYEEHPPYFSGNAHDFVDMIVPVIDASMQTIWHRVSGVVIDVAGDRARAHSYVNAHVRMKATDGASAFNLRTGVRYVDQFEKRAGEWRILHRVTQADWTMKTTADVDILASDGAVPKGMHAADDPARRLFDTGLPGAVRVAEPMI